MNQCRYKLHNGASFTVTVEVNYNYKIWCQNILRIEAKVKFYKTVFNIQELYQIVYFLNSFNRHGGNFINSNTNSCLLYTSRCV